MDYKKNKYNPFQRWGEKINWDKRIKSVCKPCWELKYCPYGTLVEQFPLPSPTKEEAIEHNKFLKSHLEKGTFSGWRKKVFEKEVKEFDPKKYPYKQSKEVIERSCNVFGHICPVFFVNEPFTETKDMRRISRNIPREMMLRIVRRDNYTCQICGKHLKDDELEFDHKIPFARGGSGEEHHIRLVCRKCNRSKGSKIPEDIKQ